MTNLNVMHSFMGGVGEIDKRPTAAARDSSTCGTDIPSHAYNKAPCNIVGDMFPLKLAN